MTMLIHCSLYISTLRLSNKKGEKWHHFRKYLRGNIGCSRLAGAQCQSFKRLYAGSLRKMDDNSKQTVPERRRQQFFTRRVGVKRYRMSNGRVRRQIFSPLEQDASDALGGSLMPRVRASSRSRLYFCPLRKIAKRKSPLASRVSPGITIFRRGISRTHGTFSKPPNCPTNS